MVAHLQTSSGLVGTGVDGLLVLIVCLPSPEHSNLGSQALGISLKFKSQLRFGSGYCTSLWFTICEKCVIKRVHGNIMT